MQLGLDEWRRDVLARMEGNCILGSKEQMSTVVNLCILGIRLRPMWKYIIIKQSLLLLMLLNRKITLHFVLTTLKFASLLSQ